MSLQQPLSYKPCSSSSATTCWPCDLGPAISLHFSPSGHRWGDKNPPRAPVRMARKWSANRSRHSSLVLKGGSIQVENHVSGGAVESTPLDPEGPSPMSVAHTLVCAKADAPLGHHGPPLQLGVCHWLPAMLNWCC